MIIGMDENGEPVDDGLEIIMIDEECELYQGGPPSPRMLAWWQDLMRSGRQP